MANSNLCSDHFTEDYFVTDSLLATKLEIKMQIKLKPDAVTTIFNQPIQLSAASSPLTEKRTAEYS